MARSKTLNDTLGVKRDIKHYDSSACRLWEATKQKKLRDPVLQDGRINISTSLAR